MDSLRWWRVSGSLFTGYNRNDSFRNLEVGSRTSSLFGGLDLNLHGFVIDPRLVTFDLGGSFQGIGNTISDEQFSTRLSGYQVTARFLPERPWPFTFRLRRNGVTTSSNEDNGRFNFATDYQTLGLNWQLLLPQKPHVSLTFDHTTSLSLFPTRDDSESENFQRTLGANATHLWKGWDLNGGFFQTATRFESIESQPTTTELDLLTVTANRRFSEQTYLTTNTRYEIRSDALNGLVSVSSRNLFFNGILDIQHSELWRGSYFYSVARSGFQTPLVETPLLGPTAFSFHDMGGRLTYQWTDRVALFGDTGLQAFSDTGDVREAPSWILRMAPGIRYQQPFSPLTFDASYQPIWQGMITNLANQVDTWSHVVSVSANAGDRRSLYVSVNYRFSNLNLITLAGAFDRQNAFRVSLESRRFQPLFLRGSLSRGRFSVLNLGGRQDTDDFGWDIAVDHPRFGVSFGRRLGAAEGLAFSDPLFQRRLITQPFPIETLVPSPLFDRDGRRIYFNAIFRVTRNLRANAVYQKERNLYTISFDQFSTRWDIYGEYRIGRVTVTAGFLDWELETEPQLIETRRFYFRISRSLDLLPFL